MSGEQQHNLPTPSAEQETALRSVEAGHNVVLHSVAGSGKTTFSLHVARRVAPRKVLMLTYNAQLKLETRRKVKQLGLSNSVEVHSFHSFGYKYYGPECRTDAGLCDVLGIHEEATTVAEPAAPIVADLLIIDECQDLKHLFLKLVRQIESKAVRSAGEAGRELQYIVVGDPRQSIYGFQGADERYLTMAPQVFPAVTREWRTHTLSVTWRLTEEMANLVNWGFLGGDQVLIAPRKSPTESLPTYHICNTYGDVPFYIIMGWLHGIDAQKAALATQIPYADEDEGDPNRKLRPSQIMVLAPSLRGPRSPVRQLENKLVRFGVPVYVPVSDEEPLDRKAIKGKLLFLTFHQAKGSERDAVIVYGMDHKTKKSEESSTCPNPAYVALTRARQHMAILQHEKNQHPTYMDASLVNDMAVVTGGDLVPLSASEDDDDQEDDQTEKQAPSPITFSVHGMLRHLLPDTLKRLGSMLEYDEVPTVMNMEVDDDDDAMTIMSSIPTAETSTPVESTSKETSTKDADDSFARGGAGGQRPPPWVQHVKSCHHMVESVSEINGIMIPLLLEVQCLGSSSILDIAIAKCPLLKLRSRLLTVKNALPSMSVEDALFVSTVYSACSSGYIFKAAQITRFDWLDRRIVSESLEWLRGIGAGAGATDVFELELMGSIFSSASNDTIVIKGRADVVTPTAIYEIKCGNDEFQLEHLLQLALYGWMMNKDDEENDLLAQHQRPPLERRRLYLVYVVHQKVYELENDPTALDAMVNQLCVTKRMPEAAKVDDQQFIATVNQK